MRRTLKLYRKVLNEENIKKAITEVRMHDGSRTAGPDGISYKSKIDLEMAIRETKLRLRRYKRVYSKKIEIPKRDGKVRTLTVINLFDRYAQQAVYRVVNPIVEKNMSKHSYGFRTGISAKVPVSRIADRINHGKETYTVEIDFEKCFDNIPLDAALTKLRELGVKDGELIKTIKHLMYTSKEYSGVGLGQGTILGPLLCNCYLDTLDRFMESEFELGSTGRTECKLRDYRKHKHEWIKWNTEKNRKVSCRYYRYADDFIVLTSIKEEQQYIYEKIVKFITERMELNVNFAKTRRRLNKTDFLGFHIMKSKSVWIKMKDLKEIVTNARKIKVMDHVGVRKFKRFLIGVLRYFDICNDIDEFLKKIDNFLYFQSRKRHGYIRRITSEDENYFVSRTQNTDKINIWLMRRETRDSFKTYIINSTWIRERELLVDFQGNKNEWYPYKWILFTKQKGKDKITGKYLKANTCVIHHIIPRSKGGSNEIENLVLISEDTHKRLYSSEKLPKEFEKYRKHLQ